MDDDAFLMAVEMGLVEWVDYEVVMLGGRNVTEQFDRLHNESKVWTLMGRVVTRAEWDAYWKPHEDAIETVKRVRKYIESPNG